MLKKIPFLFPFVNFAFVFSIYIMVIIPESHYSPRPKLGGLARVSVLSLVESHLPPLRRQARLAR